MVVKATDGLMVMVGIFRMWIGTAIGIVCRPDQLRRLVGQSIPAALEQLRVCAAGAAAGAGFGGDGTGAGASGHDSVETFEDWRGGVAQYPAGATAALQRLSVSDNLRPGVPRLGQWLKDRECCPRHADKQRGKGGLCPRWEKINLSSASKPIPFPLCLSNPPCPALMKYSG